MPKIRILLSITGCWIFLNLFVVFTPAGELKQTPVEGTKMTRLEDPPPCPPTNPPPKDPE